MEMPQVSFSNYRLGHNPEFCKMQRCIDTTHHADSNSDAPTLALVKSSELQETDSTQPISILDTDTTEDEDDDHEMTEGERKMKRILANRGSAASYLRRK
ncbi:hypothetical protein MHU86_16901 [Fragilaria crotonensis]|nr:hypothetical protein MHU86_16901 [Fragilaria crotonensis]